MIEIMTVFTYFNNYLITVFSSVYWMTIHVTTSKLKSKTRISCINCVSSPCTSHLQSFFGKWNLKNMFKMNIKHKMGESIWKMILSELSHLFWANSPVWKKWANCPRGIVPGGTGFWANRPGAAKKIRISFTLLYALKVLCSIEIV